MPRGTPRSNVAAIYASRNNVRATLDESERDKVETARDRIAEALAETLSDVVRGKLEAARDRLDEALGVAAPSAFAILARRLPRSIANIARTYHTNQGGPR